MAHQFPTVVSGTVGCTETYFFLLGNHSEAMEHFVEEPCLLQMLVGVQGGEKQTMHDQEGGQEEGGRREPVREQTTVPKFNDFALNFGHPTPMVP